MNLHVQRTVHAQEMLIEAGFDLTLFKSWVEIQLAAREIDRITETDLVKRFGVKPAWMIGENGPWIGNGGHSKLIRAFELGQKLCMVTIDWMVHLTAPEVIDMLPMLERRARDLDKQMRNAKQRTRMIEREITRTIANCTLN